MHYTTDTPALDSPEGPSRSLGRAEAELLLTLSERFGASFTMAQLRQDEALRDPHLARRLNDLVAKGWLISLGRGAYMIAPLEAGPDSRSYAVDRYLAAATIAGDRNYYLSHRTAMELHGMTLHPWRTVYLTTSSRLRAREIQRFIVRPVTAPSARLWGTTQIEVLPDHRVTVSTQARTIIDCLDRPEYAGGIQDVALGISMLGAEFDVPAAVEAALRFGRVSVIKRLGVLVDLLAPERAGEAGPLLQHVSDTPHVMDPHLPRSGRLNSRWGIWMNVSEDELLQEMVS
ncbi:MAG: type IV toxin-antitoxin system AbiEi family antitoxin [Coriobacteriia bacterium]|nr:type IV toxin-antitoxin system AbiEi family antitoxin [Coriobacteriia bacterium]